MREAWSSAFKMNVFLMLSTAYLMKYALCAYMAIFPYALDGKMEEYSLIFVHVYEELTEAGSYVLCAGSEKIESCLCFGSVKMTRDLS